MESLTAWITYYHGYIFHKNASYPSVNQKQLPLNPTILPDKNSSIFALTKYDS